MDGGEELVHPHEPAPAGGREVGAGEKGFLVWGEEEGGGPAAAPGEGLAGGHVKAVDVGPLFPVYLDGDEILIEQLGDLGVLKALPGHHMAPVAGAVADAEKDRLVLLLGFLKGLPPPGVPVHRLLGVL